MQTRQATELLPTFKSGVHYTKTAVPLTRAVHAVQLPSMPHRRGREQLDVPTCSTTQMDQELTLHSLQILLFVEMSVDFLRGGGGDGGARPLRANHRGIVLWAETFGVMADLILDPFD